MGGSKRNVVSATPAAVLSHLRGKSKGRRGNRTGHENGFLFLLLLLTSEGGRGNEEMEAIFQDF